MTSQSAGYNMQASGGTTRERLLEAATDVFGKYGYDAATTRMIAREAGVNIAAIPYYFTGKEGLYRAVIKHIVSIFFTQLSETRQEIAGESFTGPAAREQAAILLERLLTKLTMFLVGSPQAPRLARIILREQLFPSKAYDIIFSGFMTSALESIVTLIMVISGDSSKRTATLRAMSIIGQILIFRVARETAVRALDIEGYSHDETEEIRQVIIGHTRSILAGLQHTDGRSAEEKP